MTGQSMGEDARLRPDSMPSPEEVRKHAELYDCAPEVLMEMVLKERRLLRSDERMRGASIAVLFVATLAAFTFLVLRGEWIVAVPLLSILFSFVLLGYTPGPSSERRGAGGGKPPAKSVGLPRPAHGGDGG